MRKYVIFVFLACLMGMSCLAQNEQRRPRFGFDATNPDAHDPVMARCEGKYYIFMTGQAVGSMSSTDMKTWQPGRGVMPEIPQWAIEADSCSTFGKNGSAIGLMTNKTLNPESPDYKWEDKGLVVRSVQRQTNWNAIDPNLIVDEKGHPWLTWGSFWDGIQLVQLDKDFKTPKGESKTIARRYLRNQMSQLVSKEDMERANQAPDAGANAIEAPFLIKEGKYYYLFVSWDYCCKGSNSNYKVAVGRSKKITGPYLDRSGKDMAAGGGEVIAQRDDEYFGIGHTSAYKFDGQWYFMAHGYARANNGASKLVIKKMHFDKDGWPVLDEKVNGEK